MKKTWYIFVQNVNTQIITLINFFIKFNGNKIELFEAILMKKIPIFETAAFKPEKVTETKNTVTFSTILQSLNTPGENRRIYPITLMEHALQKQDNKVKNKMWYGELDHPNSNDEERIYSVSLKEQSHAIIEYNIDNDIVYGKLETLPTPNGMIVKSLILNGNTLGVSLRQLGQLKEQNKYQLVEDIDVVTYDIVSDPSFTNQTFNKKQLTESIDHVLKSSDKIKDKLFMIVFLEEIKSLFQKYEIDDDEHIIKFLKYLKNN